MTRGSSQTMVISLSLVFLQAVNARLANPNMSLFDALVAGGFQYSAEEDSNVLDPEGVSLGQRKNQLSRRLRLARKSHGGGGGAGGSVSNSAGGDNDGVGMNANGSGAALSTGAQQDLQRLMQLNNRIAAGNNTLAARALQMKDEQAGIGELSDNDMDAAEDQPNKKPRIAKFHPDFAPIFVPPQSSARAAGTSGKRDRNSDIPAVIDGPPTSLFTQQLANPYAQQNQNRPSAVAISSLTHSAQAVGLTLDQLAINLAADSTSVAKILAENTSTDADTKKMKLALRLFEMDVKTLYSTSMLRAGFDPRDCQLNTPAYHEFAHKAWEREATRLKTSGVPFELSLDDLVKPSTSGDNADDDHSHSHAHSHDGGKKCAAVECDSRHVHRIDGQCGHKAIIHKPKDGYAHIDFVVGDKVECYHGIEPVGKNADTAWPSRYKCRDAGAHGHCKSEQYKDISDDVPIPKVLELSKIDLNDPEWNYDVSGSIDGGVAGLFRLGANADEGNEEDV